MKVIPGDPDLTLAIKENIEVKVKMLAKSLALCRKNPPFSEVKAKYPLVREKELRPRSSRPVSYVDIYGSKYYPTIYYFFVIYVTQCVNVADLETEDEEDEVIVELEESENEAREIDLRSGKAIYLYLFILSYNMYCCCRL